MSISSIYYYDLYYLLYNFKLIYVYHHIILRGKLIRDNLNIKIIGYYFFLYVYIMNNSNQLFYKKYLKYKQKYLNFQKIKGGGKIEIEKVDKAIEIFNYIKSNLINKNSISYFDRLIEILNYYKKNYLTISKIKNDDIYAFLNNSDDQKIKLMEIYLESSPDSTKNLPIFLSFIEIICQINNFYKT